MIAATSGYCVRNPSGPTGWSYVLEDGLWRAGGLVRGNTSVGELLAVLMLLKDFPDRDLTIQSSSTYVVGACSLWKSSWQRKGYLKDDGTRRANAQIIIPIHHLLDSSSKNVEFVKAPERDTTGRYPLMTRAHKRAVAAANVAKQKGVEVLLGNVGGESNDSVA